MTVAELIAALEDCDPQAIVLIPTAPDVGEWSEPVADVTAVDPNRFSHGPGALHGAVRLSGFPLMLVRTSLRDMRD
jgi:hypothetical protein